MPSIVINAIGNRNVKFIFQSRPSFEPAEQIRPRPAAKKMQPNSVSARKLGAQFEQYIMDDLHHVIRFEDCRCPSDSRKDDLVNIAVGLYSGMTIASFKSRAHKLVAHNTRWEINKVIDLDTNKKITWTQKKLADFSFEEMCLPTELLRKGIKIWSAKWVAGVYEDVIRGTTGLRDPAEYGRQIDSNIEEFVQETAIHEWFDFAKLN